VSDGPRLAPLPRAEWGDDVRDALRAGFSDRVASRFMDGDGADPVPVPNVLGTLMRHPALAGPFLAYNDVLLRRPVLDPRVRELAVLRVAWRTGADYEWAQHVRIAASVGITAEEIGAVADRGAAAWSSLDAAVVAAVDELVDRYRVTDGTWTRLAASLDERQLIELVFVVGTYTGLAMAFNSFGLELDADLDPVVMPARSDATEED
jgi:alkylhydroperoxidase family enzyme